MPQNDSALVQACINGNEAAWGELVERYRHLVFSIPLRYGLSTNNAEEVFQDVFTTVFRQLPQLRNYNSLTAWLIKITHHATLRVSKKRHLELELDENLENGETPSHELVQRWERQQLVRLALERLDPSCRELIRILFLEDPAPSYEEIARRLEVPVGSIGPNRGRCLEKLEKILTELEIDLAD